MCQKSFARSDALKRHLRHAETGKESACLLRLKLDQLSQNQSNVECTDELLDV